MAFFWGEKELRCVKVVVCTTNPQVGSRKGSYPSTSSHRTCTLHPSPFAPPPPAVGGRSSTASGFSVRERTTKRREEGHRSEGHETRPRSAIASSMIRHLLWTVTSATAAQPFFRSVNAFLWARVHLEGPRRHEKLKVGGIFLSVALIPSDYTVKSNSIVPHLPTSPSPSA